MPTKRLYLKYSKKIHNYFMRFVNESDAQDLTQEVFIKVNNNIDIFRGDSSAKTWIYRIATNTAYDFLKSKTSKLSRNLVDITESELEAFDLLSSPDKSVEEKIIVDEMNSCIKEFIHRLPDSYSAVLVLNELEGFSINKIAEIMDISTGTVKVRLHRARARLKRELNLGCTISINSENRLECEQKKASE